MKKQLPETHKQTLFVIEVAPNLFLNCYEQGGAYCANYHIFVCPKYEFSPDIPILKSRKECLEYIQKAGTIDDFLSWCKCLQKEYGGDGKPRIREVTATLLVDIGDAEELFP